MSYLDPSEQERAINLLKSKAEGDSGSAYNDLLDRPKAILGIDKRSRNKATSSRSPGHPSRGAE